MGKEGLIPKIIVGVIFVMLIIAIILIIVYVPDRSQKDSPSPAPPLPAGPQQIVFLHFSDFYQINGLSANSSDKNMSLGSIARLATIVKSYKAQNKTVVVTFGGDLFSPSSMTTFLKGAYHMVDGFNNLGKLAPLIAVVGNHEFDNYTWFGENINSFNNTWLEANLFQKGTTQVLNGTKPYYILEVNGLKIGFIGLVFDYRTVTLLPESYVDYQDYIISAS